MKKTSEKRYAGLREVRIMGGDDGQPLKVTGYAAVFDSLSVPLGCPDSEEGVFFEMISPGAFSETLAVSDIRCLWNHEDRLVLGRSKAGTLKLWEDERGLGFECTLPNVSFAKDLVELIRVGNVDGCSFGFNVAEDDQAVEDRGDGLPLRRLNRVELVEISIGVTFPAYPETTLAVRSAAVARWLSHRSKAPATSPARPSTPRLRKALRQLAILD